MLQISSPPTGLSLFSSFYHDLIQFFHFPICPFSVFYIYKHSTLELSKPQILRKYWMGNFYTNFNIGNFSLVYCSAYNGQMENSWRIPEEANLFACNNFMNRKFALSLLRRQKLCSFCWENS